MSDYDPRPPGLKRDPLRAPEVDPVMRSSAGGYYLVGGVLVVLVLMAGLLFYNPGGAPGERNDQASQPERRNMEQPITPATPATPTIPSQRQ